MCVHVNGFDSLAVDHHRQALSAALLSPRRIPQPTTAENDAGRGAGDLEKIPARVHVRLPVDHFDRMPRTAGRHPHSEIRSTDDSAPLDFAEAACNVAPFNGCWRMFDSFRKFLSEVS